MSVLLAIVGAAGLTVAVTALPIFTRSSLKDRVEPYLGGLHGRPSALLPMREGGRKGERLLLSWERYRPGSTARIAERLKSSGTALGPGEFRLEQASWGLTALVGALVLLGLSTSGGAAPDPVASTILLGIAFCTGAAARDYWLVRATAERTAHLVQELPTAMDLLTLAIMAGESIPAAFSRVADLMPGGIGEELRSVVADVRAGDPIATALETFKRRVPDHAVFRLVDSLITGIEKGSPLADVLRSQAQELRDDRRRYLLELGGRREVVMLVPVVFLIMPVVIVFALWPGLVSLDLLVP